MFSSELIRKMETLTRENYSGKYGHILTELSRPQGIILKTLDIPIFGPASSETLKKCRESRLVGMQGGWSTET